MNIFTKSGLWVKRHSPELLIAGSIVSLISSLAFTVIATTKVKKVLEPTKDQLLKIRNDLKQIPDNNPEKDKKANQLKTDMALTYAKAGLKVLWVYSPAILTAALSITCLLGSHHIMKTRNIALASAYSILDTGFKSYRQRVKDKLGSELEEKLYSNSKKEKVKYTDPETGETKTKTIERENYNADENFNVLYSCNNRANWTKSARTNFEYLVMMQDQMNTRLRTFGYLTLADVYDALGFEIGYLGKRKAQAAKCLGWVYDEKDPNLDNFVDFGICVPGTRYPLPEIDEQIRCNFPDFWLKLNPTGDIITQDKYNFTDYAKE